MHDGTRRRSAVGRRAGLLLSTLALVAACATDRSDAQVAGTQLERERSTTSVTTATTTSLPATTTTTTTTTTTVVDVPLVHPSEPPASADSAGGLAEQIVDAERTVRDDSASPQAVADAAHLLQFAYRQLSHRPDWDLVVAEQVPTGLHRSLMANVAARREFLGMYSGERDRLPAWRIVAPPPAAALLAHYRAAEAAHGVPWQYLAAIHLVETAMGRVDGVSSAGALGPMQFMPRTWAAFGQGDVFDPANAIMAAARYLAHNGAPADMDTALFNYNRHDNYVRAVQLYASVMIDDPRTYRGFHQWQVYVQTSAGDVLLPVGYDEPEPVLAADYLSRAG